MFLWSIYDDDDDHWLSKGRNKIVAQMAATWKPLRDIFTFFTSDRKKCQNVQQRSIAKSDHFSFPLFYIYYIFCAFHRFGLCVWKISVYCRARAVFPGSPSYNLSLSALAKCFGWEKNTQENTVTQHTRKIHSLNQSNGNKL